MGRVTHIYLRPSARTPTRRVDTAEAIEGRGLIGDHAGEGRRQITLLDIDAWRAAMKVLGVYLEPGGRRANVVTEGVDLTTAIGSILCVGKAEVEVLGVTAPCRLMDDVAPGLESALRPESRGGVHGRVLRSGRIRVGDTVEPESREERQASK